MGGESTPFGSILDVSGIGVGHHQRSGRGWQTGTTAIVAPGGATPGVDVRGGGPGTRETEALRPENLVGEIHGICLSGGSAYGLAAADGVASELAARDLGFRIGDEPGQVVPVVPAAVVFDLARGGHFDHRPTPDFGRRAATRALRGRGPTRWGTVGAGTGARAGGLQGGVGTASIDIEVADTSIRVGALAVVNAHGSPIDPGTALPWEPGDLRFTRPTAAEREEVRRVQEAQRPLDLNTTIGVVATDAALDKPAVTKLAAVAHDGLARAIRPAHAMVDGDTIFGLATGATELPDDPAERLVTFEQILVAGADAFARACTHAILSATGVSSSPNGVPAWSELVRSVRWRF